MTVTILDGGMGQELVKRSVGIPTPLWATQLMIDSPNMVGEVHDDYFAGRNWIENLSFTISSMRSKQQPYRTTVKSRKSMMLLDTPS